MMEMEVAVENNNMRNTRGRIGSVDFDHPIIPAEKTGDMSKEREFQYWPPQMCKVALIGESAVGKTTVCELFCKSNFNYGQNYYMTCGAEIYGKSVRISEASNPYEERVNLIVVDSSGKDIYMEFLPKYWDKLDAIALMIDLTSANRLENLLPWLELAKNCLSATEKDKNIGVLIGNKSDLVDQRTISPETARQFANVHRLEYFECSARQNVGLEEPFMFLAQQWSARNQPLRVGQSVANPNNRDESRRRKK